MFAPGHVLKDAATGATYTIKRFIGAGAFGQVYIASNKLGGEVVIKALLDKYNGHREVVERFHKESRATAAISSPHVVKVFDDGTSKEGVHFFVMEKLDGMTFAGRLDTMWAEGGQMSEREALTIILPILDALRAVHATGIIHRDLKPENVFLVGTRGDPFVKLMDFGIAHVEGASDASRLTQEGANMGTPNYMAPEQVTTPRAVDHRVDVYAVGVMLYEALERTTPYARDTATVTMIAVVHDELRPMEVISSELQVIVKKAMEKDPDKRFQNVRAFAKALEEYGRRHSLLPEPSVVVGGLPSDDPTEAFEVPPKFRPRTALEHSDMSRGVGSGRGGGRLGLGIAAVAAIVLVAIIGLSWSRYASQVPVRTGHPIPPPTTRVPAPTPLVPRRITPPIVVPSTPAPRVVAVPRAAPTPHEESRRHGQRARHHRRTQQQAPQQAPQQGTSTSACAPDPVTGQNVCP